MDGRIFYPERGERPDEAQAVCAGCAEREPCLAWALAHDEQLGIWGATTPGQRRRLRQDVVTPLVEPPSEALTPSVDVRPCVECGAALTGKQERFCSTRCRKREQNRRTARARREPVLTRSRPLEEDSLERVVALAALLPVGWRLEATSSSVSLTWSPV
jgi:hypothetical protein